MIYICHRVRGCVTVGQCIGSQWLGGWSAGRVCNISASAIKILPKTNLCRVSQVRVMDTWNPETPTTDKTKDHKPLTDLGVKVNTDNLSTEQCKEVYGVLEKWCGLFSTSPTDLGRTDVVKHEIHLMTEVPCREPPERYGTWVSPQQTQVWYV